MRKTVIMIIITIALWGARVNAESMFSGNIVTVDPQSGYNALRNPALMSFRNKSDLSLGYQYSYLADYSSESDVIISGYNFDSEIKNRQNYDGTLFFSSVSYSERSSFGIGITKGGEGQMRFSSTEMTIKNNALASGFTEKTDESNLSAVFMLSYSYRIDGNESIGLQFETMVSGKTVDKNSISYGGSVSDRDIDMEQNRLTAGLTLGYFFRENFYEFGAGFKTGRFGIENKKYTFRNNLTSEESNSEISDYYIRDEGIGFVSGFSLKPVSRLRFAFEAAAGLPYSNEEKKCNDETIDLHEEKSTAEIEYIYRINGGLTWRAGPDIIIGAGGAYTGYSAEAVDSDNIKAASNSIHIYQFTAGAEMKISDDLNLLGAVTYNYTLAEMKNETSSLSMEIKPESHSIDFMAGFTMTYQ